MTDGRRRRTLDRPVPSRGGRMSTTVSARESARTELASFGDRLVGPEDDRYDEARTLFNAMIDRRPALIAYCTSRDDVAAAIRFAREHDLTIAVRGGGHNGGGLGSVDDGSRDRPLAAQGRLGRPCDRSRTCRRRLRLGRGRRGDRAAQPRRPDGDHLLDRGRRADARRRPRLPRAPARVDDRQPALGRDGAGRRLTGDRERHREP